jgi:glucose/arabinose dehydrogenase
MRFRQHFSIFRPAALLVLAWCSGPPDGHGGATNLPAGFEEETLATGLDQPSMVAWAPDGRMFVAETPGRVRVVDAAGQLLAAPVIDISDHVSGHWDHGLLGIGRGRELRLQPLPVPALHL